MRLARGRERGLTASAVFISAKHTTKSVIRIGFNITVVPEGKVWLITGL
jgi:hypothetical protein